MTVYDGLRQSRRPGGVQHPQRMAERHLLEGEFCTLVPGEQLVPQNHVVEGARVRLFRKVRQDDGLLQGRELLLQPRHDIGNVVVLATVAVAVNRDEDLRLYLRETV